MYFVFYYAIIEFIVFFLTDGQHSCGRKINRMSLIILKNNPKADN